MKPILNFIGQLRQLGAGLPQLRVDSYRDREFKGSTWVLGPFLEGFSAARTGAAEDLTTMFNAESRLHGLLACEGVVVSLVSAEDDPNSSESRVGRFLELMPNSEAAIYQGLGGALAHMGVPLSPNKLMDHFFGWMAMDSYAFHRGYFNWNDAILKQDTPHEMRTIAAKAYDQGMGRSIFVSSDGNPRLILDTINRFAPERRDDLWSGIGIMSAVFGLYSESDVLKLKRFAGASSVYLQQGITIGVKICGYNEAADDHARAASEIICGASVGEVSALADAQLQKASETRFDATTFNIWKQHIANVLATS